jgi:hypothetical protein
MEEWILVAGLDISEQISGNKRRNRVENGFSAVCESKKWQFGAGVGSRKSNSLPWWLGKKRNGADGHILEREAMRL